MFKGIEIKATKIDERLTLSEGTKTTNSLNGSLLNQNVTTAAGQWRPPNTHELNLLLKKKYTKNKFQQINVLSVDRATKAAIKKLKIEHCQSPEDFFSIFKTDNWQQAQVRMKSFAAKYMTIDEQQIEIGLAIKSGGLEGTTINKNTGNFTGLHVDSWEKYNNLGERKLARNRICFNIGLYPRYFCFINIDLQQLYNYCSEADPELYSSFCGNNYSYVWKFLEENRNYPVCRIRIDPFEAYMAPTEFILHDGSTENNPFVDIFYTLRSYYQM
ncbi:hypothetical protein [Mucilaginibacter sp. FT3.2]|uniref:hypothetical protein n=1 Tax=Mucilaginibacter sp. FT3.2 TaxID=2723090 RepID=UPI0016084D07|nr:hypothetical protein [Mucilaginibacter sp. FT3.2]MBB6234219.1 hypothetical protein [Mucilaginibacter sp. FT3.2]